MANGQLTSLIRHLRRVVGRRGDSGLSDAQLLQRWAAERDEAAFEVLMWRHGPMVLGLCRRLLRRPQDVEDAFQATFLTLVRKAGTIRRGEAVGGWLYRVASRLAMRAGARNSRLCQSAIVEENEPAAATDDGPLWRDLRGVLDEEVSRLPERYRTPFVLCCLEGKTNEEAARELGRPVGTVLSRLSWARQRLRSRLTRRGVALSASALGAGLAADASAAPLPYPLAAATLELARADGTAAALSAPHIVALVEGVSHTMFVTNLKAAAAAVVVLGLLAAGAGLAARRPVSVIVPAAHAQEKQQQADDTTAGLPTGWFGGAQGGTYEVGTDRKVHHGGKASAYVGLKDAGANDFATLAQAFQAKDYHGKRVRLTAYLKTDDEINGAGLWMRIDGDKATLAFDNMEKRRVKEAKDWKKVEIVLDVSDKAKHITFGLLITGGKVWVDDFQLETVGKDVASTNLLDKELPQDAADAEVPEKPANLDFEDAAPAAEQRADKAAALTAEEKDWLRKHAVPFATDEPGKGFDDLRPLKELVGSARIVSLGEATHGTREFFQMKHRLTEFLASEMGFTLFAIEANMPEAYRVNEYVLTGKGDPKELLRGMYFWTWDTQEVLDMILWMRQFNESGKGRMQFLGFDMQFGKVAMANVRKFVAAAAPDYVKALEEAYAGLDDYWGTPEQMKAARALSREEKEARARRAWGVQKHLEASRDRYLKKHKADEVDRAIQDARVAGQAVQVQTSSGLYRDECMADNVAWILDHSPPGSKIVLWAHNGHVARKQGWMGAHLAKRYGKDMVVLGFAFHEGKYTAVRMGKGLTSDNEAKPSAPGSIEDRFRQLGLPRFVLDLRKASKDVAASAWLAGRNPFRSIGALAVEQQFYPTAVTDEYDGLIYFERTSPSVCFRVAAAK